MIQLVEQSLLSVRHSTPWCSSASCAPPYLLLVRPRFEFATLKASRIAPRRGGINGVGDRLWLVLPVDCARSVLALHPALEAVHVPP